MFPDIEEQIYQDAQTQSNWSALTNLSPCAFPFTITFG